MSEPDALDAQAQRQKIKDLADIHVPDVAGSVMQAAKMAGGMAVIGRVMAGMRGPGKLTLQECLYYRVFDPGIDKAVIPRFLGQKMRHEQTLAVNDMEGHAPSYDKILWDQMMGEAGLPRPALKAVYGGKRGPAEGRWLTERSELEGFLSDPETFPIFAKPNFGGRSMGVMRLDGIEDGGLRLHDGTVRPLAAVIDFMEDFGRDGYLFQSVLNADEGSAALTGGGLASLRVVLLTDSDGTQIENLNLRIPRKGVVADTMWRGNPAAEVSVETGQVSRVIFGSGLDLQIVEQHPDTGYKFSDYAIPDYPALQSLCQQLGAAFPALKLQGWDISITDQGYVPIELNFGGDVKLQQLSGGRGAMTPAYCAHLKKHGYTGPLPD